MSKKVNLILILCTFVAALFFSEMAVAQVAAPTSQHEPIQLDRYRSARQRISGGRMKMRPDTMPAKSDSLLLAKVDSLVTLADSTATKLDSLGISRDSLVRLIAADITTETAADSLAITQALQSIADTLAMDRALRDSIGDFLADAQRLMPELDTSEVAKKRRKGSWIMPDSMGLSKMCWISAALPGYGQIYNKQYWKLPILYGLVGTSMGLFINENKHYKPLKSKYDMMTNQSLFRTEELDALQEKMIHSNTRRQIYLGSMIASYIYFLGDAAVNYSTNEVSHIKKATTLATICPGAGQIYNRSYWKVPFVVGGFASLIYCIDWNNRGYQRFQKAYHLLADYDAHPEKYPDGPTDEFQGRYSTSFIKNLKDSYRRNRDLCIIITAGLYVLQIIDAHVDAHLKDYDISDDLSMNIEPMIDYDYMPSAGEHRPTYGFNISLNF